MGWGTVRGRKKKKRHARDNAFCTAGVQPRSQMSQELLQRAHAQTPSAAALRMAGGSGCARTCALASSRDILGQCNKQFMSAHGKDCWCFHWGNIYTPSSSLFLAP